VDRLGEAHPPAVSRHSTAGALPVVLASFFAIGLGAAGVNLMGYLTPYIQEDLGIGRARAGAVVGLYFGGTGFGALAAGRIVALLGTRRSVAFGLTALATLSSCVAAFGNYLFLIAFGIVCGFGYAVTTVGTNVAVAAVVSPTRRALGLTGKTSGGPLFSATFALIAGLTVDHIGWRGVMAVHGACAAIALIGAMVALRRADVRPGERRATSLKPVPRIVIAVALGSFLLAAGAQAFFSWLLPFLKDGMGLSSEKAGVMTASATATSLVGMLSTAVLADRLGARGRVLLLASLAVSSGLAAIVMANADGVGLIVVGAAAMVGIAAYAAASGLMHTVTVDLAPDSIERASARVITGFFLGAWVSPIAFGWVTDHSGFSAAWLTSAGFLCAAAVTYYLCHRSQQNTTRPLEVPWPASA